MGIGAQGISVNSDAKSRFVLAFFRVSNKIARQKGRVKFLWVLGLPILALYRLVVEWLLGIELPAKTSVGTGLIIYHGVGLVVHPATKIGNNVILRQNTTIGNKTSADGVRTAAPVIEDDVDVGANVVIIGPITIGRGANVGAGSVVVKDVPSNAVVVGNPARVIKVLG